MNHIMIDLEMNKIEKQTRGEHKLSSELGCLTVYPLSINLNASNGTIFLSKQNFPLARYL